MSTQSTASQIVKTFAQKVWAKSVTARKNENYSISDHDTAVKYVNFP